MKVPRFQRRPAGYISLLMVVVVSTTMLLLMVAAYKRATTAQAFQSSVRLRVDYREKEEAILRAIVAITPNRAMRAMQSQSVVAANSAPLRWETIFSDALALANARQSISDPVAASLGNADLVRANAGDAAIGDVGLIFKAAGAEAGMVSAGLNRSLGSGYPVPLSCSDETESSRNATWPIISSLKTYGVLAENGVGLSWATYPNFNVINYPNINFGYARPGQPFVAKRNWWAFSLELAGHDAAQTYAARAKRDFVVSIYEIPSQLAISAASFMALGQHASGTAWANTTVAGGVFSGRALVEGETALERVAARTGISLSNTATVGGLSFTGDPLVPGLREDYLLTQGDFFPVSLASESGRAAFISINRGPDYLDRFSHAPESNTLSSTTWNNYSVGALQCAMQLDVTQVVSAVNKTPTELRFTYLRDGVRQTKTLSLTAGEGTGLPAGYLFACNEDASYNFGTTVVDVAYGKNGVYAYQKGVMGTVTFNNARFGDPLVEGVNAGYFRPSYPFEIKNLATGKICVAVYPQRFAAFLSALGADSTAVNHSLVVNVDYTAATGSVFLTKPSIPCTDLDYGVILQESADLTSFPKGFSLVTNLRLYFGDDFNVVTATPPAGYLGEYRPPCSIFAAEKRYGVNMDPLAVELGGQMASLIAEDAAVPSRPLDARYGNGGVMPPSNIHANLRPITHPADLPPISMMNWLVLLEERKSEYYAAN
jgi:hypothetical protein